MDVVRGGFAKNHEYARQRGSGPRDGGPDRGHGGAWDLARKASRGKDKQAVARVKCGALELAATCVGFQALQERTEDIVRQAPIIYLHTMSAMGDYTRQKGQAGSVARISAQLVEDLVINAIRERLAVDPQAPDDQLRRHVVDSVSDVIVYPKKITIRLQPDHADAIEIPWQAPAKKSPALPPPSRRKSSTTGVLETHRRQRSPHLAGFSSV